MDSSQQHEVVNKDAKEAFASLGEPVARSKKSRETPLVPREHTFHLRALSVYPLWKLSLHLSPEAACKSTALLSALARRNHSESYPEIHTSESVVSLRVVAGVR